MRFQQFTVLVYQVIGVEALVIHTNLLHLFLVKVGFDISLPVENLITNRAAGNLFEPAVDAIFVVDVEAAQHSALALIDYWLKADNAVTDHVLTIFHTDEDLLYLGVGLRSEPLINLILGACYHRLILRTSLLVLLIFSLLPLCLRIPQRYTSLLLSLSIFSLNLPLVLRVVVVLIQNKLNAYEEDYAGDRGQYDRCYLSNELPINIAAFFCWGGVFCLEKPSNC